MSAVIIDATEIFNQKMFKDMIDKVYQEQYSFPFIIEEEEEDDDTSDNEPPLAG